MLKKITSSLFFLLGVLTFMIAQSNHLDVAKRYINENATAKWQLTPSDFSDMYVSDNYADDDANPLTHVYFIQKHAGIQLHNGVLNVNIMPNDEVIYAGSRFMPNLAKKVNTTTAKISAEQALNYACQHLKLNAETWLRNTSQPEHKMTYDKGVVAYEDITVQLVYQRINNDEARLAYHITLDAVGGSDYWTVRIDAQNGDLLEKKSLTNHCKFHDHNAVRVAEFYLDCKDNNTEEKVEMVIGGTAETGSYNVFAFPTESPIHGNRTLLQKPVLDSIATPFGWHDTDGIFGAPNYTITRGNNVHAYQDRTNKNTSLKDEPDGGTNLNFDFPYSPTAEPDSITKSAVTNLFYVNNFMHDLAYVYGMNEKAGSFQQNNYGRGANNGQNDAVQAEAQDGAALNDPTFLNNANFATPSDGGKPRMQMYVWTSSGSVLKVLEPQIIAGTYEASEANGWGKKITTTPLDGDLIIVKDASNSTQCCGNVTMDLKGKVAVIDRGGCEFGAKALKAQKKGAIGVIIVNFDPSAPGMAAGASGGQVTIPVVSIGSSDGDVLKKEIAKGNVKISFVLPTNQVKPGSVDGDLDNGIIAHEYGHGISNRLTGGPSLSECLSNAENMGEGWSDFMTLITTAKAGDTPEKPRGVGNFANRTKTTSIGIRSSAYSTDMSVNPNTYDQSTGAETHRLGEIWTSMCWDLYWKMSDKYGFDPDVLHGKGGNNKAIKLVFDGMKIQACNPGFTDGRDAILAADKKNFNGENQCLIWEVFARRGLGKGASQGDPLDAADPTQSFKQLPECLKTLKIEKEMTDLVKAGDDVTVKLFVRNDKGTTSQNVVVSDLIPQGASYVVGSANKGATVTNNIVTFKLGTYATDKKDTLTYKFRTNPTQVSKTVLFENFDKEENINNWDTELLNDAKNNTQWGIQKQYIYKGASALGVPMEDASEADVAVKMNIDKRTLITGKQPVLRFYRNDLIQQGFDGMVVYITKNEGATWEDLGSYIFKNGYTGRLSYGSLAVPNQYSFWGDSKGFIPTYVDLSKYLGDSIQVRFRFVSDKTQSKSKFEKGSFVDNFEIMDMVNYNSEATLSADGEPSVKASAEARGAKVESTQTVAVNDIVKDLKVQLYPNPADDYVNISLAAEKSGVANIAIVDANGRQVIQRKVQLDGTQLITIGTSSLPAGLYTVKVNHANENVIRKLIVF